MSNSSVKIVRFHQAGGPEVLKIEDMPLPEPGKGEVFEICGNAFKGCDGRFKIQDIQSYLCPNTRRRF